MVASVSSGHSADYLLGAVAGGRENYYLDATTSGEPPGRWSGAGAASFGLTGEVDPDTMKAIFGEFIDPRDPRFADPDARAGAARLGQAPGRYRTADEVFADLLAANPDALPEEQKEMRAQAARTTRQPVAFVDVTFSPPKSVTVLHTAYARAELDAQRAGDEQGARQWAAKRTAVEESVWAGNQAMLDHMSETAGYSRAGRHGAGGGRWVDAHKWTVASFFQHTSRENDPQLHVHNAVLNRVVCDDGQVRTLDSKAIHKNKQGAGTIGDRVMEQTLTAKLGVRWVMRADGVGREVEGVDQAAMDLFSTRKTNLSRKAEELIAGFRARHGREPSSLEVDHLRREASMKTRKAKSHDGETAEQELDRWADELRAKVGTELHRIAEDVGDLDAAGPAPEAFSPTGVIEEALSSVQAKRPAWSRSELRREILLALPDHLGTDRVAELAEKLTDQAIGRAVQVTGSQPTSSVPEELRVASGESSYQAPAGPRYATRDHVVAEQALRRAAVERGRLAVDGADVDAWLAGPGASLGADQAAAVRGMATSGAAISVLSAPAGTGKSYTVGALSEMWSELTGGRVVGLATSQIATEVLAEDGVRAMNTARWLATQDRLTGGSGKLVDTAWALTPQDIVVVDEASMVTTEDLTRIRRVVDRAGARLVVAGDPRQLAAVGAGGGLAMLADGVAETHTLAEVRRFEAGWERDASLRLRDGDPKVIDVYDQRGRVRDSGTKELAGIQAARGYLGDTLDGKSSIVVVPSNDEAAKVSAGIREQLVELGRVDAHGTLLGRDGNIAGRGDLVQARLNNWAAGVVNRRRYVVDQVGEDGSLLVTPEGGGEQKTLPAAYVATEVTLGYASTAHAAQGVTVDTAHVVARSGMSPEGLYVGMSRGRQCNTAYVATQPEAVGEEFGETHERDKVSAAGVLGDTLATDREEQAAALDQAAEDARRSGSMHTIHARAEDAVRMVCRARLDGWLDELAGDGTISEADRQAFAADQGTEQLSRQLRAKELDGHDPRSVLAAAVQKTLDGARSVAQVVQYRIDAAQSQPAGPAQKAYTAPAGATPEWDAYLGELRDAADQRRRELGAETAAEAPQWAVDTLGPVPADPVARLEWEHRAGVAAAYREASPSSVTEANAIGPSPGTSATERRAAWRDAWTALGRPEAGAEEQDMSEGALRVRVKAWEREQTWAPAYANDDLRDVAQAAQRERQEAAIAEAAGRTDEAVERRAHADALAAEETRLTEVVEARAAWFVETAATHEAANRAQAELAARGRDIGAEDDRVTAEEWLAAEDQARVEDDEHRQVTEDVVADDQAEADARAVLEEDHADDQAEVTDADAAVAVARAAQAEIADRKSAEEAHRQELLDKAEEQRVWDDAERERVQREQAEADESDELALRA